MDAQLYIETIIAFTLRVILFFTCRRYLLRSLYHDLRQITSNTNTALDTALDPLEADMELSSLPTTTSHSPTKPVSKLPLHSTIARVVFSLCFSECCSMFIMLMCQGVDVLSPNIRLASWRISLLALLALILVIIPLALSLVLTVDGSSATTERKTSALRWKLLLYFIPVGIYLYALSYVPLPPTLEKSDLITSALARLIVVGTIILGILSGFGAMNNAWLHLGMLSHARSAPTENEFASAERSLAQIKNDLEMKRTEQRKRHKNATPAQSSSWLSRVTPSFRGDDYEQEITGLEALEFEMAQNVEQLQKRRERAKASRTCFGQLIIQGGRLFAVYCAARILSTGIHIILPTNSAASTTSDYIAQFLATAVSLFATVQLPPDTIVHISRQISLGLVGVIILTTIGLVLRGVAKILRITSKNLAASLMILLLAQLMGLYFIASIVQLRTTFPPSGDNAKSAREDQNLFSSIPPYEVFGSLFDWAFLLSSLVTGLGKWGIAKFTE